MRLAITVYVAALLAILPVHAAPPLSELGKASEALHFPIDLNKVPEVQHVSSYPEPGQFVHSDTSPFKNLHRPTHDSTNDPSFKKLRSSINALAVSPQHQPTVADSGTGFGRRQPSQATQEGPFSHSGFSTPSNTLKQVVGTRTLIITPGFDRSIEKALKDPLKNNFLKLPNRFHYVHSDWFEAYYAGFVEKFSYREWRLGIKFDLPLSDIDDIVQGFVAPLREGSEVYRLPVIPKLSRKIPVQSGEVLIKMHNPFILRDRRRLNNNIMSVWASQDNGKSVAFLGLYHAPRAFRPVLLEKSGAVKYKVVHFPQLDSSYLVPFSSSLLSETSKADVSAVLALPAAH